MAKVVVEEKLFDLIPLVFAPRVCTDCSGSGLCECPFCKGKPCPYCLGLGMRDETRMDQSL